MNKSELTTIIAALRFWQWKLLRGSAAEDLMPDHFGGGAKPLTVEEIDRLAERLNFALEVDPKHETGGKYDQLKNFKVWVYVEAIDEEAGEYFDLMDLGFLTPPSLGEFAHFEDAWRFVLDLPGCRYDESDLAALGQAARIEKEVWESPARDARRYEKEGE